MDFKSWDWHPQRPGPKQGVSKPSNKVRASRGPFMVTVCLEPTDPKMLLSEGRMKEQLHPPCAGGVTHWGARVTGLPPGWAPT